MRQHPGTWACAETCSQVSRVLFTKPLKEHRLPKGWSYHYYCPLPSCKYHLSQNKSFPSYSLLKQHYSKMHAHRSKICGKCNAAFSTDVYLRRHEDQVCGRLWACQSC